MKEKEKMYLLYMLTLNIVSGVINACQTCNQPLASFSQEYIPYSSLDIGLSNDKNISIDSQESTLFDEIQSNNINLQSGYNELDNSMNLFTEELKTSIANNVPSQFSNQYSGIAYSMEMLASSPLNENTLDPAESSFVDLWSTENFDASSGFELVHTIVTTLFDDQQTVSIESKHQTVTATPTTESFIPEFTISDKDSGSNQLEVTSYPYNTWDSIDVYNTLYITSELLLVKSTEPSSSTLNSEYLILESMSTDDLIITSTSSSQLDEIDESGIINFNSHTTSMVIFTYSVDIYSYSPSHKTQMLSDKTVSKNPDSSLFEVTSISNQFSGFSGNSITPSTYLQNTLSTLGLASSSSYLSAVEISEISYLQSSPPDSSLELLDTQKTAIYPEFSTSNEMMSSSNYLFTSCLSRCDSLSYTTSISSYSINSIKEIFFQLESAITSSYESSCYPSCTLSQSLQLEVTESSTSTLNIKPTSPLANVTSTINAMYPIVIQNIGALNAIEGIVFNFKLPSNSFYDVTDGFTPNLNIHMIHSNGNNISAHSWIQFNANSQALYGLPLQASVGSHYYNFTITNTKGFTLLYPITINVRKMYINATIKDYSRFILAIDKPLQLFANVSKRIDLISRIASYFGDSNTSYITTLSLTNGSTIITWTNATIPPKLCSSSLFERLTTLLVDANGKAINKFVVAMLPEYPIISVVRELSQSCNQNSNSSPSILTIVLVPTSILLLIIIIITLIIVMRKRYGTKEPDLELHTFYKSRKPMVMVKELEPPMPIALSPESDVKDAIIIPEKSYVNEFDKKEPSLSSSGGSSLSLDSLGTTSFCPKEHEKELESLFSDANRTRDISSPDSYHSFLQQSMSLSCSLDRSKDYDDEFCLDSPSLTSGYSTNRDEEMTEYNI
ncbi:Dystroglycan [Trichoplax sp. H2]|nr:Dystroglycan [Trichoplax sp. H2]|eukprot:RDD44563.1 Dystroglycan [Trichoplax sp. H2]